MVLPAIALAGCLWPVAPGRCAQYLVTRTSNAGTGSLRWAINQANSRAGPDRIAFSASLNGSVILPTAPLPALSDGETTLNADIDGDKQPDIALNGKQIGSGSGLVVQGDGCVIMGLAVTNFPNYGIELEAASFCKIRACHVGVNLAGTKAVYNGSGDIVIWGGSHNRVGGFTLASRNVLSGGDYGATRSASGVFVASSSHNTIAGNYIGLNRAGTQTLGNGGSGVHLSVASKYPPTTGLALPGRVDRTALLDPCTSNTVGGTAAGERNVIGGVRFGALLDGATDNVICGNWIGLAGDGDTLLPIAQSCVDLEYGAARNTIGGTATGSGNVFAGGVVGVYLRHAGTAQNRIQGNYFGLNAGGTRQCRLAGGVILDDDADPQTIGGNSARAGNYFTPKAPGITCGVLFQRAGSGTLVRHNRFGVRPNGMDAAEYDVGVVVTDAAADVTDNLFARAQIGVGVEGPASRMRVFRNIIRQCETGVLIGPTGRCLLGNLDNANTRDDGGNYFRRSNSLHINNQSARKVLAQGNDFGTTRRARINEKIHDRRDDPGLGRVVYSPLMGGLLPTGQASALAITGAWARPTNAGGAAIVLSLSTPAQLSVTVLNVAGRAIATICTNAPAGAGTQQLTWHGRSDAGTTLPKGTYLVRILARDAGGQQAASLVSLRVGR